MSDLVELSKSCMSQRDEHVGTVGGDGETDHVTLVGHQVYQLTTGHVIDPHLHNKQHHDGELLPKNTQLFDSKIIVGLL